MNGATARIFVRYIVGGIGGAALAQAIINDPDLMTIVSGALSASIGLATEVVYSIAKKRGWTL